MHKHYSYYWRRCRECGRPAVDASEYCEECTDQLSAEDEAQQEADAWDREIADQIENDAREAQAIDSVPRAFPCTCASPFASSASLQPPSPILDRYCPQHGDGGPDPDRALADRLQAIRDRKSDLLDNGD